MDGPLSKYLESRAPQPTQAALERMLAGVARVRVYAGGLNWDRPRESTVLADVHDAGAISAFKQALRIVDGAGGHCMCDGEPTLELLGADGRRLAVLGVHHGLSIRWSEWKDDARLAEGMDLLTWLDAAGVSEPLDEFIQQAAEQELAGHAWNAWLGAMPQALRSLPEATWQKVIEKRDLFPLLAALAKAYPDKQARAAALLEWHGNGGVEWTTYPTYEDVPAAILAQFPEGELARIVEAAELTPAQACGAARFFACHEPSRPALLPSALGPTGEVVSSPRRSTPPPAMSARARGALLQACIHGTDDDGRALAEAAFLSAPDREFLAALRALRSAPVMLLPSQTPFAENAQCAALAAHLAHVDAAVPKGLDVDLRFVARPAGDVEVSLRLYGDPAEQEARRQTVWPALERLPAFNTAKSELAFFAWYSGGE